MRILPAAGSTYSDSVSEPFPIKIYLIRDLLTNLKRHIANVDFPLPVLPSNPTRSLGFRLNDTPLSTSGRSGAYLISRFSTMIIFCLAEDGQYAGRWADSAVA